MRSLLFLVLAGVLVGCSESDQPSRYPVRGQVFYGDQPLADAIVRFHPKAAPAKDLPKPMGIADATGNFQLTTLTSGDGAPTGDYTITVELRQERLSGEELTRDGPNLLPAIYSKPETSPLTYSVTSGTNEVPPIKIPK